MTDPTHSPLRSASFEAVVFDLDGTLIDSHAAMIRCYDRWAGEFGISLHQLPALLGMPNAAVSGTLLPPEHVAAATARIEELEVNDTDGVIALPGAKESLELLPPNRVAIATSCTTALMRARLTAAGLPFPDVIVTRDDVARGKPAPDSFLLAAELLRVDPARVLVVEDAPAGVAAAHAAGCAVLGIASTKNPAELSADAVVSDLSEIEWRVADDGAVALEIRAP